MNVDNLMKLKAWLEAGAPHFIFDPAVGEETFSDWFDGERIEYEALRIMNAQGKGDCGSVCCVAGAAELMHRSEEESKPMHLLETNSNWYFVRNRALHWLGLPEIVDEEDERTDSETQEFMGHPLFNPQLAPKFCTPQQAAEAVQRVIDGNHPWPVND